MTPLTQPGVFSYFTNKRNSLISWEKEKHIPTKEGSKPDERQSLLKSNMDNVSTMSKDTCSISSSRSSKRRAKKNLQSTANIPPPPTSSNRLIHWFCVIGTDKTIEKEETGRASHIQLHPAVLDTFPAMDSYSDVSFPPELPRFVFPNGCRPSAQQKSPLFFTFVLTSGNGVKMYGSVLQVYDEVMEMDRILESVRTAGFAGSLRLHAPVQTTAAASPTASTPSPTSSSSNVRVNPRMLYLPKCLVILSQHAMYNTHRQFLSQIYQISLTESPLPIERYISNFCTEVPLPPRGKIEVHVGYIPSDPPISISRPAKNALPLVGFSYRPLFSCLSIENIMVVFGCLLTETRVVLLTRHVSLLGPVGDALLSLLFPFTWQGVYIPILPQNVREILEAPVPFLVGMNNSKYLTEVPPGERPLGVVFVDLDKDVVHLGFGDNDYKRERCRKIPVLYDKAAKKLKAMLEYKGGGAYLPIALGMRGTITSGYDEPLKDAQREEYSKESIEYHEIFGENFGRKRNRTLAMADRAFPGGEHRFPVDMMKKESRLIKCESNNDRIVSLLDTSLDETPLFSAKQIRTAFMFFFVTILSDYEKFIEQDTEKHQQFQHELFCRSDFLQYSKIGLVMNCSQREYLREVISTQMLESFVREKVMSDDHTCDPGLEVFDALIDGLKNQMIDDVPCLTDDSKVAPKIYHTSKPSGWGLPNNGRSYRYDSFPKLNPELFGPCDTVSW